MIRIVVQNVMSMIVCDDVEYRKYIIRKLKRNFRTENSIFLWRKNPALRYTYMVNDNGKFYTGIFNDVYKFMTEKLDCEIDIIDIRIKHDYDISKSAVLERLSNMPIKLRPYQKEAFITGIKKPRGVFQHATGAGKTIVMSALIKALDVETLIVTGKKDLQIQLAREISEYTGEPVGMIGSGKFEKKHKINVALAAGLYSRRFRKDKVEKIKEYLETVKYICFDEAHHLQSKSWQTVSKLTEGAYYRHGFTATFMTSKIKTSKGKEQVDTRILQYHTGPVIHEVDMKFLIKEGYLSRPVIRYVKYHYDINITAAATKGLSFAEVYERDITNNVARNMIIENLIATKAKEGKQVIVFVRTIEHGENIKNNLIKDHELSEDSVKYVNGQQDKFIVKVAMDMFKAKKINVLIGTSIIGEGLNFFCNVGVNAGAGDSDISAIQKLGRILRKDKTESGEIDKEKEDIVEYYDFYDINHAWFKSHAKSRHKIYKSLGVEIKEDADFTLESMIENYDEELDIETYSQEDDEALAKYIISKDD